MKLPLILIAGVLDTVVADQPVNCLRTHVHNNVWNFHVSKETNRVNLFQTREVCTHTMPNKVQVIDKNQKWKFAQEDVW